MRTHTQGHDWPERDTNLWRPAGLCRHCLGDIHHRLGAGADPQGLCSVLGAQGIVDYIGSIQLKPGLGHGCLDARPAHHHRQGAEIGGHTSVRGQGRFGRWFGAGSFGYSLLECLFCKFAVSSCLPLAGQTAHSRAPGGFRLCTHIMSMLKAVHSPRRLILFASLLKS